MAVLKIPTETKLKNLPLETRVALRLVTLAEAKQVVAEIRPMAKELRAEFMQVMMAVVSLEKQGVVKIKPITAASFEFEVEANNRAALQLPASNYHKHLKVQASKVARQKKFSGPPPAHLMPIPLEQRQPFMEKATTVATKIGAPRLAFKVANCMVRVGEEEVNKLLENTLRTRKDGPQPPKVSCVSMFFKLYRERRNVLVPPPQTTSV